MATKAGVKNRIKLFWVYGSTVSISKVGRRHGRLTLIVHSKQSLDFLLDHSINVSMAPVRQSTLWCDDGRGTYRGYTPAV